MVLNGQTDRDWNVQNIHQGVVLEIMNLLRRQSLEFLAPGVNIMYKVDGHNWIVPVISMWKSMFNALCPHMTAALHLLQFLYSSINLIEKVTLNQYQTKFLVETATQNACSIYYIYHSTPDHNYSV